MYERVPFEVKEDLALALAWATEQLTAKEGAGWQFQIHPNCDSLCSCTFSKLEWSGEHYGSDMATGSEAIVMAVCEYLTGN